MKQTICGAACLFAVVAAMVACAELAGENEIIFPEVAALSVGCLLPPRLAWRTILCRMVLCISACALAGVLIVRFVPLPLLAQFVLAFAVGQLALWLSRTTFAPLISAIALPVLMQTRSFVYVAAAVLLTALVCLLRLLLEKCGVTERSRYEPLAIAPHAFFAESVFRTAVVAALAAVCFCVGVRFCVAPPLRWRFSRS